MALSRVTRLWSSSGRFRRAALAVLIFASVFAPLGLLGRAKADDTGLTVAGTMPFGFAQAGVPHPLFIDTELERGIIESSLDISTLYAYDLRQRHLMATR